MLHAAVRQYENKYPLSPVLLLWAGGGRVKGDVIKVILRESNRYIPNENLSMDWYTTLAMLSATMPSVQMARLARV